MQVNTYQDDVTKMASLFCSLVDASVATSDVTALRAQQAAALTHGAALDATTLGLLAAASTQCKQQFQDLLFSATTGAPSEDQSGTSGVCSHLICSCRSLLSLSACEVRRTSSFHAPLSRK